MKTKRILIVLALIGLLISGFQKNTEPLHEMLTRKLAAFTAQHPEEKVYLHFDRPFYKPGDDIWFNAFVLDGSTHRATSVSDVVYVELNDPKGSKLSTLELFVQEGSARGDFRLPDYAPGGMYTVRAYTQWMRNAGEQSFYSREIQVQKVITPRMLLKLDYEKEAYGAGDDVTARLTVKNLKNEPLRSAIVDCKISLRTTMFREFRVATDHDGNVALRFSLPDTLTTKDGLLQAIISYGGEQESISRSIPIVLNKVDLQFFPEGGDLVAGVRSRVAFKAINEYGKAADIAGVIIDESGRSITSFESLHMGMGSFMFEPADDKRYFAVIERPVGNTSRFELPKAIAAGFVVEMNEIPGSLLCKIHAPRASEVFLVGQSHGVAHYASKIRVAQGQNSVEIPVAGFPSGIAVFTLFNQEGMEEWERLIFVNKNKVLNIQLETDKKV
ncbi:MAG TPA: MG2 domain-containing protein, partial [Chryseosolibacter sp.]|nr:MG2 domain-containing protein [Chryseosolibacter sp.]